MKLLSQLYLERAKVKIYFFLKSLGTASLNIHVDKYEDL